MPQNAHKAFEAKKLIDASMPKNIGEEDKKKLEAEWAEKARLRNEAIAREVALPEKPTLILRYELHKFGRHWNSAAIPKKGKPIYLLPAPSLFTSAVDAIGDRMVEDATRS